MGGCASRNHDYVVKVKTGDKKGAGMDANVKLQLIDVNGDISQEFKLDNTFRNDFERGKTDSFNLSVPSEAKLLRDLKKIKFSRDNKGVAAAWYVETVHVTDNRLGNQHVFPVFQWIKPHFEYIVVEYDTSLPQTDTESEQRATLLKEKHELYQMAVKQPGLPVQIKAMPDDETFSWDYKWDIVKRKAALLLRSKIVNMFSSKWDSLDDMNNVYTRNTLPLPMSAKNWRSDLSFAKQRTHGCSIGLIKRCTEIPSKLAVTDEMMKPIIENLTLAEAIDSKRLFMVDLDILVGLIHKPECHICCPVALFFENKDKNLVPVAIQLEQQPGPNNPVFLPTDPEYTWLMAKMWYNNADAIYHQSLTHLGFTHLIMEGVCVSANRQISQSHPVFKLLAPHFLYLIAINSRGLEVLISEGGWVDKTMSCGIAGMFDLISKGTNIWRVDVDGTLPVEMERRGLNNGEMHEFPFRDDGLLIYNITRNYVSKTVNHYYDTPEKLTGDWEVQAWGKELVLPKADGGVGINGVPGNGTFTTNEQLITLLTCIITTCSLSHAAANFPQYDEYAFPPNFPALLNGLPPKSKDPLTEKQILDALPDKATTLDIMVVTKILSDRGTKPLSDFEVSYVFDPPAKKFVQEFRDELTAAMDTIDARNKTRAQPYTVLHPKEVPNSISI